MLLCTMLAGKTKGGDDGLTRPSPITCCEGEHAHRARASRRRASQLRLWKTSRLSLKWTRAVQVSRRGGVALYTRHSGWHFKNQRPATFSKPAFSAPSFVYPMKDISGSVQMPMGNCRLVPVSGPAIATHGHLHACMGSRTQGNNSGTLACLTSIGPAVGSG